MEPLRARSRREFLRLAALGSLGFAAACRSGAPTLTEPTGTTTPPSPSPDPTSTPRALRWRRVAATGPSARRDHTLTADADGSAAYLFGGRADGTLKDLWVFSGGDWTQVKGDGPAPRFGHNAAFVDGRLLVFGGQDGPTLYNDLWAYDPATKKWSELEPRGGRPGIRYGAGGDRIGDSFVITHGFQFGSRYDDTWSFDGRWADVSPRSSRPVKRCLHRSVALPGSPAMVLFGGQTDGRPFMGDTWIFDAEQQDWSEVKGKGPSDRNLYAAAATEGGLYLFGGKGPDGDLDDVWFLDGRTWSKVDPPGDGPGARSGIEGTTIAGPSMMVFGGRRGSKDLDDLWELTLPA